jgi:hypothetical protein
MEISFTHHAKYRIMERNISVLSVRQTIKHPDSQRTDEYGMMIARKKIGEKLLEVVYRIERNKQIVITAYYEN